MKNKNIKNPNQKQQGKKQPHLPQQYVPQVMIPNIHATNPIQCSLNLLESNPSYVPIATPYEAPPEWVDRTEEEINNELMLNPEEPYNDPSHDELANNLPLSFLTKEKNDFAWLRPTAYILNSNIDREIRHLYPKKKYTQMREEIKVMYEEEKNKSEKEEEEDDDNGVDDLMKDDSVARKKNIYKDFFKFFTQKIEVNVIRYSERDETEEEYKRRVEETIERQKNELLKFKTLRTAKSIREKKLVPPTVQKPEEIPHQKIYDEDPSNIDVKNLLPPPNVPSKIFQVNNFLNWVSSIYQFILDLEIKDCQTKKMIFSNIYPQKSGVPIYNPNGHYCIKLYFMGKPRRIDIDDRIPCSKEGEYIFPRCESLSEIWPALFTKALMKLNVYKVRHPFYTQYEEKVDTSYIYSLTGLHSEINSNCSEDTQILETLTDNLSDDMVLGRKRFLLCMRLIEDKYLKNKDDYDDIIKKFDAIKNKDAGGLNAGADKEGESNQTGNKPGFSRRISMKTGSSKLMYRHLSSLTEGYLKFNDQSTTNFSRGGRREKTSIIPHFSLLDTKLNVFTNYAYSINDYFSNNDFNMNRIKPLDFSDLKQKLKDTTVVFKQLSQQEKKEYIRERKILKSKQLEIKNKRIEEVKQNGIKFLIIKIKNSSINQYKLNSILSFDENEINMAKKCLLNHWKYPPPEFFDSYFKKYEEVKYDENKKPIKIKIGSLDWTRQAYLQLIGDEVSKYTEPDIKEPILKTSGGNWMNFTDFKSLFNTFLILHNPLALFPAGQLNVDNTWNYYKLDIYEPLEDFTVFKLTSEGIENQEKNYSALITFEPNNDKTLPSKDKLYSYIIIDLYDDEMKPIEEDICLNRFYSTKNINNLSGAKSYYIILKGGIYQFGFFLQLYTEAHKIENMSFFNYLKNIHEYQYINFKVEHPLLEVDTYYLITRLCISANVTPEGTEIENPGELKIIFNVKYNLKYIKPYIDIYLTSDGDDEGKKVFINEEISLPEGKYFVAISFNRAMYTLKENSVDIDVVYSNKNYKIEQVENVDFFQINDYYTPNRHNIIFKELIYASDKIYASLDIGIKTVPAPAPTTAPATASTTNLPGIAANTNAVNTAQPTTTQQKKDTFDNSKQENKIKLIFELYQIVDPTNVEVDFIDSKYSYGLRGKLLKKYEGYNMLTIPHLKFEGGLIVEEKKKGGKQQVVDTPPPQFYPYLFICYVDHDVDIKKSIAKDKLNWIIKVFPSDSLCFIKDTSKEEHEKELKNQWELDEPGRAQKAKVSRKRFLIEKKQKLGKEITEEEKTVIAKPRERKSQETQENQQVIPQKGGARKPPRVQPSSKKLIGKQAAIQQQLQQQQEKEAVDAKIDMNKKLPLVKEHTSNFVKTYLDYAYQKRTIEISTITDQYKKTINTDAVQTEKTHKITESVDDFDKVTKTEMNETFYKHENKEEFLSSFYKTSSSFRSIGKGFFNELVQKRDVLKNEFQTQINAQNKINDVLVNHAINNYDMNYIISVYKEGCDVLGKEDGLVNKIFALISRKKDDEIEVLLKKFSPKEKNNVIKLIEDIEFNQWNVNPDLKSKLKDLVK